MKVKSKLVVKEVIEDEERSRADLSKSDPEDCEAFASLLRQGKSLPLKPVVERLEDRK